MIDLKSLRESHDMTQAELAEAVEVTRQTITEYEAGHIKPSIKVAKALGAVLNFDWTKIFD